MAEQNLRANSGVKTGLYRGARTYFIPTEFDTSTSKYKLLTTHPDGTSTVPDHILLPLEETSSIKKVLENWEVTAVDGLIAKSEKKLKTVEYKSKLLQRDVATLELDETWAGVQGILIMEGFLVGAPVDEQEYVAIFGEIQRNESELDSKEGRPEFLFKGVGNDVAIAIKAGGDIVPPDLTPAIDITIPARKMYKRVAAAA